MDVMMANCDNCKHYTTDVCKNCLGTKPPSLWEPKTSEEMEKMRCEIQYLTNELNRKKNEMLWYRGFRSAVELIFGKENWRDG